MGIIYDVFRVDFDVEKSNLVVGVYGVFGDEHLKGCTNNNPYVSCWLF